MERKFLVDYMLGRLARWLRLLGEDAEYYQNPKDNDIVYRSLQDKRIILSRDRKLSKKTPLGLLIIESEDFKSQLKQVIKEYGICVDNEKIYSRCSECNMMIKHVEKEDIKELVPEFVYKTRDEFSICHQCKRIFWKGTHKDLIKKVLNVL